MPPTTIDTDAVRREQTAVWDAVSAGWARWRDPFEDAAEVVSRRLVRLAGLRAGQVVLDFGTGLGEPARTAAQAVGPAGHVRAVDLSAAMIDAARSSNTAGHVRFAVGDVEVIEPPPGGYDAVLSRWALMFAGDRAATLGALAGALRPGGVFAAAVWGPPAAVPMIALGFGAISRNLRLDPPPPGGPGPFSMADPVALAAEVAAAGLAEVSVQEQVVAFVLGSPQEFARFTADVLPPRMRATVDARCAPERRPALWAAVAAAAEPYLRPDGTVHLPSTALCVRAVR